MKKNIKVPLTQTVAGLLALGLALPSKSLILLGVSLVLLWIGVRGLINFFGNKPDDK